jgi:hypothetical protein
MFRDSIGAKGVSMSVSNQDRKDYEEGLADREKGTFDTFVKDISGQNPGNSAYFKGRAGDQLDDDKKDK